MELTTKKDIITLIGFMGSGKSSLGRQLASIIGYGFIDLDDFIEEQEAHTISEIFHDKGEDYFRQAEQRHLKGIISSRHKIVLALGGGTPCNNEAWTNLRLTHSIYLQLENSVLLNRLKDQKSKRPLIANLDETALNKLIDQKLRLRAPYYERANLILDNAKDIKHSCQEIIDYFSLGQNS